MQAEKRSKVLRYQRREKEKRAEKKNNKTNFIIVGVDYFCNIKKKVENNL